MYIIYISNDRERVGRNGTKKILHSLDENSFSRVLDCEFETEINAVPYAKFTILPQNPCFDELKEKRTMIFIVNSKTGETEWEGTVSSISSLQMNEEGEILKEVECEGVLGWLNDTIVPEANVNFTSGQLIDYILQNHNELQDGNAYPHYLHLSEDIHSTKSQLRQLQYRSSFEEIKNNLIDLDGGEISAFWNNVTKRYEIQYIPTIRSGSSSGNISLSDNMKSITAQSSTDNTVTRIIPLGKVLENGKKLTIEKASKSGGKIYIDARNIIVNGEKVDMIARNSVLVKTKDFSDCSDPNELYELGKSWLEQNCFVENSYSSTILDLSSIYNTSSNIITGKWYKFENKLIGLNDTLRVIKKTVNIYEPYKPKIEIGAKQSTISNTVASGEYSKQETVKTTVVPTYKSSDTGGEITLVGSGAGDNATAIIPNVTETESGLITPELKLKIDNLDETILNNLENYYTKSETYSQNEIDEKISKIPKFSIEVVQELPTNNISATTVYLLKSSDETGNLYTEYIYVNNNWEKLGAQLLDLSILNGGKTDYGEIIVTESEIKINKAVGKSNGVNNGEVFNNYDLNSASGYYSHSEGNNTKASASFSHTEGWDSIADGVASHAEGRSTARGYCSHAEGNATNANGDSSHSEGIGTIANGEASHVIGKYNIEDNENKYAFIIGNGTSDANRSNAIGVGWDGSIEALSYSGANATTSKQGLMSPEAVIKLNSLENYVPPKYTPHNKGMYNIEVNTLGHISEASPITKSDITSLGIPENDTRFDIDREPNINYLNFKEIGLNGEAGNEKSVSIQPTLFGYSTSEFENYPESFSGYIPIISASNEENLKITDDLKYFDMINVSVSKSGGTIRLLLNIAGSIGLLSGGLTAVGDVISRAGTIKGRRVEANSYSGANATQSAQGLMSAEDKTKLDGIEVNANNYVHPSYISKPSGFYKVTVDNGHVSAVSDVEASDLPEHEHNYLPLPGGTLTGNLNVPQINGNKFSKSGDRFGVIPIVDEYGVMEIGKYIDLHFSDGDTSDYGLRITASSKGLELAGAKTGRIPVIDIGGTIDIGKNIDFHLFNDYTNDYDLRVTAESTGLTLPGTTKGTFSGNLSGNASSSTKLINPRNINGVPFDGTSDIVTPINSCYSFDNSASWNSTPWHKVASTTITKASANSVFSFYVNRFNPIINGFSGILRIAVRSDRTIGKYNQAYMTWDIAGEGIVKENFLLVYTETSSALNAEIWVKHTDQYQGWQFVLLASSSSTSSNTNDLTLYNSTSGEETYTSGTGVIVSSLSKIQNQSN